MSKFMLIVGILFAAVGVALGLTIFFSPGSVVGWGITPEVAVTLLVGGALSIGLAGVIQELEGGAKTPRAAASGTVTVAQPAVRTETFIPEFGRKAAGTVAEAISPAVQETITALEQAKTDIRQALGEEKIPDIETPAAAPVAEEEPPEAAPEEVLAASEEEADVEAEAVPAEEQEEGQLYVVEERTIRSRAARILSDGTVEAETEEGWMRFENLEHLDEYLDAMAPADKA
jgi:hypothetical protein